MLSVALRGFFVALIKHSRHWGKHGLFFPPLPILASISVGVLQGVYSENDKMGTLTMTPTPEKILIVGKSHFVWLL